jgi:hypothetical protein
LVPQREDLDVFVSVAHRQQPQQGEGVGRGEVGQARQHESHDAAGALYW